MTGNHTLWEGQGEEFEINDSETDPSASEISITIIQNWNDALPCSGLKLEDFPSSVVEVDRYTVKPIDHCRGVL